MPKYQVTWVDYNLPTGQEFSVAVCGRTGRIRHMYIGKDDVRRLLINQVEVEGENCDAAEHCLDMECPLNKTEGIHLAHMLDMPKDEELDEETAGIWGTASTVEGLVEFARRMNDSLPEELRRVETPGNEPDETPEG